MCETSILQQAEPFETVTLMRQRCIWWLWVGIRWIFLYWYKLDPDSRGDGMLVLIAEGGKIWVLDLKKM